MWKRNKQPSRENNQNEQSSLDKERSSASGKSGEQKKRDSDKGNPSKGGQNDSPPKPKKAKTSSSCYCKSRADRKNQRTDIKAITGKIKRTMYSVEKAVDSEDAQEPGVSGCVSCEMSKEMYKRVIQQMKIVEEITYEVIQKEQKELMDAEDSNAEDDDQKPPEKLKKGIKCSVTFDVYCAKPVIKHNLKCLLVTLQKMMGDTMAQICFVKTRNLGGEERFRHFDVSISDLNLLRYQLARLTDLIIALMKRPAGREENEEREGMVCLGCVKEKVTDCLDNLREVLQNGKNLKFVKTEFRDPDGGCCPRVYPHVHSQLFGKPIVFKYTKPELELSTETETHGEETDPMTDESEVLRRDSETSGDRTMAQTREPETPGDRNMAQKRLETSGDRTMAQTREPETPGDINEVEDKESDRSSEDSKFPEDE